MDDTVRRWLVSERLLARARYEMALLATREPNFREQFVKARDRYVEELVRTGLTRSGAAGAVAMIDGLVLDAMIRGGDEIDSRIVEHLLHTALA